MLLYLTSKSLVFPFTVKIMTEPTNTDDKNIHTRETCLCAACIYKVALFKYTFVYWMFVATTTH